MRQPALAFLTAASVLALACSDTGVEPPDDAPAALSVTGAGEVDIGGTLQLDAQATNATGQAVAATASWSTSSAAVATVDATGRVTGVARGTVTIRAEVVGAAGPVADTHDVMVRVASISLAPGTGTLASLGDTLLLTAEAKDAAGATIPGVTFSFTTSDGTVATVSGDGAVVALANGQATVRASVDSRSAQATVTVRQVAVALAMATGVDTLTSFGDQRVYTATAADARGNAVTGGFTWAVSNPSVAAISGSAATATATATGNGSTDVQVGRDGLSAGATLVVRQVVAAVGVSPSAISVLAAATGQLTGTPQDARGNAVAGSVVAWSSGDESVATVDAQGVVTGVAVGNTAITATSGGKSGIASVTVAAPSLSQHVQPVFSANCALSGCHTGPSPAMGQDLSAGQAWSHIVNVPSVEAAGMDRVEPGDPDMSYLIHKIQGTQLSVGGSGQRMPLGGTPLTAQQIAAIRAWVKAGAPNN